MPFPKITFEVYKFNPKNHLRKGFKVKISPKTTRGWPSPVRRQVAVLTFGGSNPSPRFKNILIDSTRTIIMDFSRLTRTQKKRVKFLSKKRRRRQKEFEQQASIIKHFILAFTAGIGFILLWSGISRWSGEFMSHGEAMAVGLGLLLVSGFITRIFIKNFS